MFNVLARIDELRIKKNWSVYKLAKESGIPQSTIATWYQKNLFPPIDKLEILCDSLGISLSDFFSCSDYLELTSQQLQLLRLWYRLKKKEQTAIIKLIENLL